MIPRVVLDTNVIVSGLLKPGSVPDQVLRLALSGHFALYTSPAVLDEYAKVLPYTRSSDSIVTKFAPR